jgi:hypothetical protein
MPSLRTAAVVLAFVMSASTLPALALENRGDFKLSSEAQKQAIEDACNMLYDAMKHALKEAERSPHASDKKYWSEAAGANWVDGLSVGCGWAL